MIILVLHVLAGLMALALAIWIHNSDRRQR